MALGDAPCHCHVGTVHLVAFVIALLSEHRRQHDPASHRKAVPDDGGFSGYATRIVVMSETLPLANVKSKFSEMVDRVEHTHDRIIVTRNGRPAAVLISPEELASLEDTLELLSDPDAMRQLDEARRAHEAGDFVTGDELRSRYLMR